jgi:hypothetical protein
VLNVRAALSANQKGILDRDPFGVFLGQAIVSLKKGRYIQVGYIKARVK